MPDYTTRYVFELAVEGEAAVAQAKKFREQIQQELGKETRPGGPAAEQLDLAKAIEEVNKALSRQSSIVSRLATNLQKLQNLTAQHAEIAQAARQNEQALNQEAQAAANVAQQLALVGQQAEKQGRWNVPAFTPGAGVASGAFDEILRQGIERTTAEYLARLAAQQAAMAQVKLLPAPKAVGVEELSPEKAQQVLDFLKQFGTAGQEAAGGIRVVTEETKKADSAFLAWIDRISKATNAATVQYFGLRRLGYGIAYAGISFRMAGQEIEQFFRTAMYWYLQFDRAVRGAAAALNVSTELYDDLSQGVMDLATSVHLFEPDDIARGIQQWAEATGTQVRTQEDLNRVLQESIYIQNLATIQTDELGETAESVGSVMRAWGMSTQQTARVTEEMNYVATKTRTTIGALSEGLVKAAEVGRQANTTFDEMVALLAMGTDVGFEASTVTAQMTLMYRKMLEPTKEYDAAWNRLLSTQLKAGQTWKDIVFPEDKFIGWAALIDLLAASTENLGEATRTEILKEVSSVRQGASFVIAATEEQIRARKAGANAVYAWVDAMKGATTAEEEAYLRSKQNLFDAMGQVQSASALYQSQMDTIRQSTTTAAQEVENLWRKVQTTWGEAIAVPLLETDRMFAKLAQRAADIFSRLPLAQWGAAAAITTLRTVGTTLELVGRIVGSASNFIILWKAVQNYQVATMKYQAATTQFQSAVSQFQAAVAQDQAARTKGATTVPVPTGGRPWYDRQIPLALGLSIPLAAITAAVQQELVAWSKWQQATADERAEMAIRAISERYVTLTAAQQEQIRRGFGAAVTRVPSLAYINAPATPEEAEMLALTERERAELYPSAPAVPYITRTPQEEQIVETWSRYLEDRETLEREYDKRLSDIRKDFAQREIEAQRDLQQRLLDLEKDFNLQESRRYEDYLLDREKILAQFGELESNQNEERERAARDLYRRLEELEQQHNNRMIDLLEERDVRGLVKEMRDYRQSRERLLRDYADREEERKRDRERQRQDIEQRLADLDESYRRETARRREDYALRRAEAMAEADQRIKDLQDELSRRLAEERRNYAEERALLKERTASTLAEEMQITELTFAEFGKRLEAAKRFMRGMGYLQGEGAVVAPPWLQAYANVPSYANAAVFGKPAEQPVVKQEVVISVQQQDWQLHGLLTAEELFKVQEAAMASAKAAVAQAFSGPYRRLR